MIGSISFKKLQRLFPATVKSIDSVKIGLIFSRVSGKNLLRANTIPNRHKHIMLLYSKETDAFLIFSFTALTSIQTMRAFYLKY